MSSHLSVSACHPHFSCFFFLSSFTVTPLISIIALSFQVLILSIISIEFISSILLLAGHFKSSSKKRGIMEFCPQKLSFWRAASGNISKPFILDFLKSITSKSRRGTLCLPLAPEVSCLLPASSFLWIMGMFGCTLVVLCKASSRGLHLNYSAAQ